MEIVRGSRKLTVKFIRSLQSKRKYSVENIIYIQYGIFSFRPKLTRDITYIENSR